MMREVLTAKVKHTTQNTVYKNIRVCIMYIFYMHLYLNKHTYTCMLYIHIHKQIYRESQTQVG